MADDSYVLCSCRHTRDMHISNKELGRCVQPIHQDSTYAGVLCPCSHWDPTSELTPDGERLLAR